MSKNSFIFSWPSIIFFIPFILFNAGLLIWLIVSPSPDSLTMAGKGLKEWAVFTLIIWAVVGAGLYLVYKFLSGKGGDTYAKN